MKFLKSLFGAILTSALDKRKQELKQKLIKKANTTKSDWVKTRCMLYQDLLDGANKKTVKKIENFIKE